MRLRNVAIALLAWLCCQGAAGADSAPPRPSELYPGLFERVQLERVYEDGKTFVDALPRKPPQHIREEYARRSTGPDFDLAAFVDSYFERPDSAAGDYHPPEGRPVTAHIDALWDVLAREPDEARPDSSLLPLPYRYVVPGGRFREIYYWDSYFTLLGLLESGRDDLARGMVDNFAWLIDRYGHVPNGNRSYYLSRSQPPFFSAMVELMATREGGGAYRRYLAAMQREHEFWMAGAAGLAPGSAAQRVVRLADGSLLNRYWDDRDTPREESYREDVETARSSGRPPPEVYRHLRAAAESGWDFSSRWFADGRTLATIHTTDIVPVDLNSLLYGLERSLARAYRAAGQGGDAAAADAAAARRRRAMQRHLWDAHEGVFGDYDWRRQRLTGRLSAATLYPLFTGAANGRQATRVAEAVETRLLQPDGLATTLVRTGQQWDAPNGWAPLQWIAVAGLHRYGHQELACDVARRWIHENVAAYRATGKLVEKYDVSGDDDARGGEYPLQDGFGWTNGVLRRLLALYPAAGNDTYVECAAAAAGAMP